MFSRDEGGGLCEEGESSIERPQSVIINTSLQMDEDAKNRSDESHTMICFVVSQYLSSKC